MNDEGKKRTGGRHQININKLIKIVDVIAAQCIDEYETKREKYVEEKRRVDREIKRQREEDALQEAIMNMRCKKYQRTCHCDEVSEDEEPDEDDLDFIVDDDEELSVAESDDEETDKTEINDE